MKKWVKWMVIGGLGFLGLIIVALLIIPFFVDLNRYKPFLEEKVSAATGRPFQIGSDLRLSLFPWAGVAFSDLKLGNPPGFDDDPFATIDAFEIRVKLLALLSRHLEVSKFVVDGPLITLIKRRDGQTNWQFSSAEEKTSTPTPAPQGAPEGTSPTLPIKTLAVDQFSISRGKIVYVDQAAETRREITDFELNLQDASFDKPVHFKTSAKLDGRPAAVAGTFGPLGDDPGRGTIPLDLTIEAVGQLTAHLTGTVTDPVETPAVNLVLEVNPFSPKALLESLQPNQPIRTADPQALEEVGLKANIAASPSSVSVTEGKLLLDDTNLTFALQASQFERPNLKFDIDVDRIDLDRYLPPDSAQGADEPQGDAGKQTGSPDKPPTKSAQPPTDYTALRRLILDGRLKIGTLIISKASLTDVQLAVNAKEGRLRIDPFSLTAFQGSVAGSGLIDVKGKVPASTVKMRVGGLQLAPLIEAQAGKHILEGTTNATIDLNMVGDTAAAVKRSLGGSGEVRISDGAIVGVDLAAMARNLKAAFGMGQQTSDERPRTDFSELLVPFTIQNGVVKTSPTSLKSPFLRMQASGSADLVKGTLDFRIEPKVVGTIKGQGDQKDREGIMVPILVSGSFAKPQFRPDLKSIAKEQIDQQVFENEKVKEIIEKNKLQQYEEPVKNLLKGFMKE